MSPSQPSIERLNTGRFLIFSVLVVFFGCYISLVPEPNELLPGLKSIDLDLKNELDLIYPEDIYEGGGYVKLPFGETRYYNFGNPDGIKLVFVHGIGPPSPVFLGLIRHLGVEKYNFLLYDLFGRGYSESPGAFHDENLYMTQLTLLLHHVGWISGDVTVVGYSLGGAITVAFSSWKSEFVSRVILIAPAGLLESVPVVARVFSSPIIGEAMSILGLSQFFMKKSALKNYELQLEWESLLHVDKKLESLDECVNGLTKEIDDLMKLNPKNLPTLSEAKLVVKEVIRMLKINSFQISYHQGFLRSFLSTLRHFPVLGMSRLLPKFEHLGHSKHTQPVFVIWGSKDGLIPISLFKNLKTLIPRAILKEISDAGHGLVIENSTAVATAMNQFLLQ